MSSETLGGLGANAWLESAMAVILLMTLLVPVVVWIAVCLENILDRWDRAAAVRDQPSPGETNGTSAPEQTRPA
jgi:heme exporter protein D